MNKWFRYFLKVFLFILILQLGYSIVTGPRGFKEFLKARKERIRLFNQLQQVKYQKAKLEDELIAFKNDPYYLEGEIRIHIKKGRKGEIFYVFPQDDLSKNDERLNK